MADVYQRDSLITHVTHRAMATDFVVLLPAHQSHRVESVVEALELLDTIEAKWTIYRPDSEVSRINQLAWQQPVRVSTETFELLERSIRWGNRTQGAFDITAGPLVEAWGFTKRSGKKPTATEIETARAGVGFDSILLDSSTQTVRFAKPAMSINLGAIGKGAALDQLAKRLLDDGVDDFLIHGGNSSVIAHGNQEKPALSQHEASNKTPNRNSAQSAKRGTQQASSHQGRLSLRESGAVSCTTNQAQSSQGWAVGIAHPTKPKHRVTGVWLKDAALATSGSGKQFFHHQGKRYGHVIDPRTGYPAGDWLSITVIMPNAADADACATGLFVMEPAQFQNIQNEPWAPDCVTIETGQRQDQVIINALGTIHWVDPPERDHSTGQVTQK